MKTQNPKILYVDIENGVLQSIYGDKLDTNEQIMFVVRDHDNIKAGDEDPVTADYTPQYIYW